MIEVNELSFAYKTRESGQSIKVLDDISFSVARGEFIAIIGPSGCGKSTLLRIIGGLIENNPYMPLELQGDVYINGKDPDEARMAGMLGYMFQETAILPWRKTIDNIKLPSELNHSAQRPPEELLELVGLQDYQDLYPDELSGGMKKRVSLARALSINPQILLMDEPLSALDEFTREEIQELLVGINKDPGTTIVYITHNISEAVFMADKIIILSERPARIKSVEQVSFANPRDKNLRINSLFNERILNLRKEINKDDVMGVKRKRLD